MPIVEDPRIVELRQRGATIGKDVFLGPDVYIELDFCPLLTIEDGVVIAGRTNILLHDSALNNVVGLPIKFGKVILRSECYIGANCTILCGVEIGTKAIIGTNSLVTQDIPAGMVAYGHPAKVHGSVEELATRYQKMQPGNDMVSFLDIEPWRVRRKTMSIEEEKRIITQFLLQMVNQPSGYCKP